MHRRHERDGCDEHDDRERTHVTRILPAAPWQTRGTPVKKLLAILLVAGVVAAVVVFALHGRGRGTSRVSTTTAAPTMPVQAYFYRGGALVPVVVHVPTTEAVAGAATRALLAGPPAGYTTALPAGASFDAVTIAAGTARASFSAKLAGLPRTAQAQIVYTLTQFPTVQHVLIDAGGSPVSLSNGAGETISGQAGRADYGDLTSQAQIFVAAPTRGSTVTSPVTVSGTASVVEGTIALEVWTGGKRVDTETITASSGAPERGTFSDTLSLPPGSYELVLYEPSAADGSHLHPTTVDITVAA